MYTNFTNGKPRRSVDVHGDIHIVGFGYLQHGKVTRSSTPPTVRELTGDTRCPRCGRRHSFTGPFWDFARLEEFYLCNCGVRYVPPDHSDQVGITDF